MITTGLLVGAHFRPPTKLILPSLRGGTPLELRPEPENPYDSEAVAVWLRTEELTPLADQLREVIAFGRTLDELILEGEMQLGYLAREGNKDLKRLEGLVSAGEVLREIGRPAAAFKASLWWGPNGETMVKVEIQR